MTKLPAGNTGRHEDSILWDRLRADLNNLGAAYGVLPEPQGPLTPFGEALQSLSHGLAGVATSQPSDPDPVDRTRRDGETLHDWFDRLWSLREKKTGHASDPSAPRPVTSLDSDRNAYFDGIILAARKKREALAWLDEPLTDDERDICHQMWDEQERAERVASALSKPLDYEPRLGWKPGDCE